MLLGICGQAGSGKDTVADHLCLQHQFVKVGFADPLKRICKDVFNFSDEQLWGPSEKRNAEDRRYPRPSLPGPGGMGLLYDTGYLTPRHALQTLGTEWGRHCYADVWVDYAIRIHAKLQEGGWQYRPMNGLKMAANPPDFRANVVISDVRFRNEVEGIKKAGGYIFRIIRPGAEGNVGVSGHASEMEQKSIPDALFDGVILNASTIVDLFSNVSQMIAPYMKDNPK